MDYDRLMEKDILVRINSLCKGFSVKHTVFDTLSGKPKHRLTAVDNVDLDIYKGEILGIVGESGCGKTTFAKSIIQLYKPDGGEVFFQGTNLVYRDRKEIRKLCSNFQMIFQDPFSSLNPRIKVREIISEALMYHKKVSRGELDDKVSSMLNMVGLTDEQGERFPGELSGGQQQRVGIARALAVEPKLIIADEPVSALDVSIQAQILNLLKELQNRLGISVLFISHDLRVVRYITHRVAVMYLGKIIEIAETDELYDNALHPYTQVLLKSNPSLDPRQREEESALEGEPPSPMEIPGGCRFHKRCKFAKEICRQKEPMLADYGSRHMAACHFASCVHDGGIS